MQGTTFLEPLILRRPPRSLDLLPDGGAEVLNRAAAAIRASNTRPGTIWPFPQGWPVISPLLKESPTLTEHAAWPPSPVTVTTLQHPGERSVRFPR